MRVDQIATTRVLPKASDYSEVGNATPESAKLLLSRMPQRVQTFAELTALVIAAAVDGFPVIVQGGAVIGDGLGGLFRYSAASAVAADGANYLAPDVGAGRWIRHTDKSLAITFATVAALKAFPVALVPNGSAVNLLGYYAAGDGGGGPFMYDSASAAADNGGTVIAPTVGAGRWLRQNTRLTPRQFGAVGDGVTNDTAFLAALIAALPAGGAFDGERLSYATTGITVNKALTISNTLLVMLNPAAPVAVQKNFNITADDVTLIDCGSTIVPGGLGNVTDASGVFASAVSRTRIIRGTWNGSKNAAVSYNAGTYHSPLQFDNCTEPAVIGPTRTLNAQLESLFFNTCTRPLACNVSDYGAGNSSIATLGGTAARIYSNYSQNSGASGFTINTPDSVVAWNHAKDSGTHGINIGEFASDRSRIFENTIDGAGQNGGADFAGIQVQAAVEIEVTENVVRNLTNNTGAGFFTHGIQFVNLPISFRATNNFVSFAWGDGIRVVDNNDDNTASIVGNHIDNPWLNGISVLGCAQLSTRDNYIQQANRSNNAGGMGINFTPTAVDPVRLEFINDTILDTTPRQRYGLYLGALGAAVVVKISQVKIRGWVTQHLTSGRACIYEMTGNDFDGTARAGSTVATNGAGSTVINTGQVTAADRVLVQCGNAAAVALALSPAVTAIADGSFTVSHKNGTAAGETIRWVIF